MKCEQKCMIKKQPIHVSFFVRTVLKEIRAHSDQNLICHTYFGRREYKPVCQTKPFAQKTLFLNKLLEKILKRHDDWSILKVKLSQTERRGVVKTTGF